MVVILIRGYKYKINEEINSLKILEQIRIFQADGSSRKGYLCECVHDGYLNNMTEYNLNNGRGCPICSRKKTMTGVNDIATTHPNYIKFFKNKEDSTKYSYGSGQKTDIVCPFCKHEKRMTIKNLFTYGFSCSICGDGISYPEKLIGNMLIKAKIEFETQLTKSSFGWCDNFKYDFYLPKYSCIIETNGIQHYASNGFSSIGRSLEEEQKNDKIKRELALSNGIKYYIELDCRYSNLDYIINSIEQTELKSLIKLSQEDLKECDLNSQCSLVHSVYKLMLLGKGVSEICEELKISRTSFYNYKKKIKQFETLRF